jgi:uncharacterized protein
MRIVISGGSGFIGKKLVERLANGNNDLTLLSRNPDNIAGSLPRIRIAYWDAKRTDTLVEFIRDADAIINLAGEPVAGGRWTAGRKHAIRSSRLDSTKAIIAGIEASGRKPLLLINASAVGFYGNVPHGEVTESSPKGGGFLADLCSDWENEALRGEKSGVRVVLLRTGIVLDKNGGALKKFLLPFHLFAGGIIGSGEQWMPWIHINDMISAVIYIIENSAVSGPVNLSAPEPVQMKDFCRTLGEIMRRPSLMHIPAGILKMTLGEMAVPLILEGQKVVPEKLLSAGYKFRFPGLEGALRNILDQ